MVHTDFKSDWGKSIQDWPCTFKAIPDQPCDEIFTVYYYSIQKILNFATVQLNEPYPNSS